MRVCVTLSATALADALATGAVPARHRANAVLDCTHAEVGVVAGRRGHAGAAGILWASARCHRRRIPRLSKPNAAAPPSTSSEARHAAKMPRGNFGAMNTIRSEIKRKRGHMPIRKLFKTAGETLQRIKPVLLMSPISVAQFVPPGSVEVRSARHRRGQPGPARGCTWSRRAGQADRRRRGQQAAATDLVL